MRVLTIVAVVAGLVLLCGDAGTSCASPTVAADGPAAAKASTPAAMPAVAPANMPTGESHAAMPTTGPTTTLSVWGWVGMLFGISLVLGILAVLGGVGGGVLYVPLVGSFMPFHLDFVRCAGLMVALAGSVAAGPGLLKRGLADLRLAMPMALIASASSIVGAMVGLSLPKEVVQTAMGATILLIAGIMVAARKSDYPVVKKADYLSRLLGLQGAYVEQSSGKVVQWQTHRTAGGMALFVMIGVMAGMFGLGAGWANVPALNLLLGAPLKLAVATSKFLIGVTDSTAAWVYINNGASLPLIVIPSIAGIMLGSIIGVRLLAVIRPQKVRWMVLLLLAFSGGSSLLKGLGVWK